RTSRRGQVGELALARATDPVALPDGGGVVAGARQVAGHDVVDHPDPIGVVVDVDVRREVVAAVTVGQGAVRAGTAELHSGAVVTQLRDAVHLAVADCGAQLVALDPQVAPDD